MLGDVLLGPLLRVVAAQVVGDVLGGAPIPGVFAAIEHVAVLQEIAEQHGEIFDLDVAIDIGLGEADSAALQRLLQHLEVAQRQVRMHSRRWITEGAHPAVGEGDADGTVLGTADQPLSDKGSNSREQMGPRRGRRCPRFNRKLIHDATFQNYRSAPPSGQTSAVAGPQWRGRATGLPVN